MCGILGRVAKSNEYGSDFSSALAALHRRGPDASGVVNVSLGKSVKVTLGHTRLAILDLTPTGAQPMQSADRRYSLVFNGEIYNFRELRSELQELGYHFNGTSDTEVLLNGYRAFGIEIIKKLDGMFAFALLDAVDELIIIARDPFGKKPLFTYCDDETFAFASEITALKKLDGIGNNLDINYNSVLQYYIFGFVPAPQSIFKQINKHPPSSYAIFDLKKWALQPAQQYWSPVGNSGFAWSCENDLIEQIDSALSLAVSKRMVADVPICMFLSGGVDSSLVLAKAATQGYAPHSFSISFPGYRADESRYARMATDHLKLTHEIIPMDNADMSSSAMDILDYLDEPIADAALLPLYYLAKKVAPSYKVALGGDGGDEVFGGYIKYRAQNLIEKIGYLRFLAAPLSRIKKLPDSYRRLAEGMSTSLPRRQFIFGSGGFLPSELIDFIDLGGIDNSQLYAEFEKTHHEVNQLDAINRSLYLDCRYQLPDWYLVKSDRATMANGVELRSPLLDKSLSEMLFQLPGATKISDKELKYVLKRISERYLPKELLYRPKLGFSVDFMSWTHTSEFRNLVLQETNQLPIKRSWVEKNIETLSPLKLMRIAFMNHFVARI